MVKLYSIMRWDDLEDPEHFNVREEAWQTEFDESCIGTSKENMKRLAEKVNSHLMVFYLTPFDAYVAKTED